MELQAIEKREQRELGDKEALQKEIFYLKAQIESLKIKLLRTEKLLTLRAYDQRTLTTTPQIR